MKTNTKQSIIALMTAAAMAIPFALAASEPGDVNNVIATVKNATTLEVTWDAVMDNEGNPIDHYRIYYGTQSVLEGDAPSYDVEVDTPDNQTVYDLGTLTTDSTYFLAVTAIDSDNIESSNYSIEATGTPTEAIDEGDTTAPIVLNVISADKNHVLVGFSETINLPELLAEAAFTITEQINEANILEVTAAEQYLEDPEAKTIILTTADQTKNVNYIVTASVAITDIDGNPIESGNTDSGLFLGSNANSTTAEDMPQDETIDTTIETEINNITEDPADALLEEDPLVEEEDITPPENITNLLLNFKEQLEKFVIIMNWTSSIDSAKDLVDQVLYSSMDKGLTYDTGQSLGATTTTHQIPNLEGGKEYTFKITTKDASGNESVGVVKSIRLPQTGPLAGLLVLGSALAAGRVLRRKKRQDTF